jgi:colanic acid/amylovoran biosynthesis glycosyltransferase
MSRPLRIAVFTGIFPVVSETFIVRQIAGLLEAGHAVRIYADCRSSDPVVQPEAVPLLDRTTWMDMPPETAPWEMPVTPFFARTWPPGSQTSVHNCTRLARALPILAASFVRHPRLTIKVLSPSEYGYQARSLSALYRLRTLATRSASSATGSPARAASGNYDVLHAHFGPVAKSFRFARTLWRAPLIASFHGYDFCTVPRREGRAVYEKLFAEMDLVTVNSDYTRAQLENLGCPPHRIRQLPVGLNLSDFPFHERRHQPGAPIRVITVGRLVEIKGHEYVIRAIGKLCGHSAARNAERHGGSPPGPVWQVGNLPLRYDIVGDGPLRPKLQKLADELGLEETVVFHGARTGPEVRALLELAHIFVLGSVSVDGDQEGQGLVVQEAQASGLPIIVTQHGALPQGMRPGASGFVVPERDVDALADRLSWLAAHPETWPEMGRCGRAFVEENYDARKLNAALIKIYLEAIELFKTSSR